MIMGVVMYIQSLYICLLTSSTCKCPTYTKICDFKQGLTPLHTNHRNHYAKGPNHEFYQHIPLKFYSPKFWISYFNIMLNTLKSVT